MRARFITETLHNLRANLGTLGSGLLVTMDKPEVFLPKLISPGQKHSLVYQYEICKEELDVEELVEAAVKTAKAQTHIERVWGSTIHHIDDLPMDPAMVAPQYTKFR